MSLVESQLAAIHDIQQLWPETKVVIIGATALFGDRPTERERDLVDIAYLLDAYVEEDDVRRWDEAPEDGEFDLAPAHLFGLDVARVLAHDAHRTVVSSFLNQIESPESWAHLLMLRDGPARWHTEETALARRLRAFKAGMQAAIGGSP